MKLKEVEIIFPQRVVVFKKGDKLIRNNIQSDVKVKDIILDDEKGYLTVKLSDKKELTYINVTMIIIKKE